MLPPQHAGGSKAPMMPPQSGNQGGPQQRGAPQPGAPQVGVEPEGLRNLMVNYIPTTIDELQLRQLFEMYGPVESVKIVLDRETRSSRGYGFIKYRFAFSAVHAIQYLNGYPLINKRLKVAYANHEQHPKGGPQHHGGGGSNGSSQNGNGGGGMPPSQAYNPASGFPGQITAAAAADGS